MERANRQGIFEKADVLLSKATTGCRLYCTKLSATSRTSLIILYRQMVNKTLIKGHHRHAQSTAVLVSARSGFPQLQTKWPSADKKARLLYTRLDVWYLHIKWDMLSTLLIHCSIQPFVDYIDVALLMSSYDLMMRYMCHPLRTICQALMFIKGKWCLLANLLIYLARFLFGFLFGTIEIMVTVHVCLIYWTKQHQLFPD